MLACVTEVGPPPQTSIQKAERRKRKSQKFRSPELKPDSHSQEPIVKSLEIGGSRLLNTTSFKLN